MGVVVDGTAYSLSAVFGSTVASADALFPDWDTQLDRITAWSDARRAGHADASPLPSGAQVLPPVEPRNVFQAAANYRKHVIDLMIASPRPEHADLGETDDAGVAVQLLSVNPGQYYYWAEPAAARDLVLQVTSISPEWSPPGPTGSLAWEASPSSIPTWRRSNCARR